MSDNWGDDRGDYAAAYEAKLSPFGRFVFRTERRIRRCELQAELVEARARVAASKVKGARKGRSRRPAKKISRGKRA
jgi:hypothetical protein